MFRAVILTICFLAAITACDSDGTDNNQVRVNPTPTFRSFPTAAAPRSPTPDPFATPTATISGVFTDPNCQSPVGWQAYVVASGDTLGVIAETIGSDVVTIQQGNCLSDSDTIFVGQVLYLPSLPAFVTSIPQDSLPPANCAIPTGWQPYIVVAGDTLGTIAEGINSSVTAIQNGNCLTNADTIFVGQILYLPALPINVTPVNLATATNTQVITCTIPFGWQPYTVVAGDTLALIAARFSTTVGNIQNGNCLTNINQIFAGQILYVPPIGSIPLPSPTATLRTSPTATFSLGRPPAIPSNLIVRPTIVRNDGAYVTLQLTIALDVGVVLDADRVRYYAAISRTDLAPVEIGVDNDPFDGTRLEYTFNQFDDELYFFASAENEFGSSQSLLVHVVYDPNYVTGTGRPNISPFLGFDGSIYTLNSGQTVTLTWLNPPANSARIEFYLVEDSRTTQIATDNNPTDGVSAQWRVPTLVRGQTLRGLVYARAVFNNGAVVDSESITIFTQGN